MRFLYISDENLSLRFVPVNFRKIWRLPEGVELITKGNFTISWRFHSHIFPVLAVEVDDASPVSRDRDCSFFLPPDAMTKLGHIPGELQFD